MAEETKGKQEFVAQTLQAAHATAKKMGLAESSGLGKVLSYLSIVGPDQVNVALASKDHRRQNNDPAHNENNSRRGLFFFRLWQYTWPCCFCRALCSC